MKNPDKEVRRRSRIMVRETAKEEWGLAVPSDEIDAILDKADDEERASKTDAKIETDQSVDKFNGLRTYSLRFEPPGKSDLTLYFSIVAGSIPSRDAVVMMTKTHPVNRTPFVGKDADFYSEENPVFRKEAQTRPSKASTGINVISSRYAKVGIDELRSLMSMEPPVTVDVGGNTVDINARGQKKILEWIEGIEAKEKDQGGEP